uniref:Carbonic anhydrase n=1 Tax=Globodera rostochiensis TaxID=31243 RepID=A0A914I0L1_GLORO
MVNATLNEFRLFLKQRKIMSHLFVLFVPILMLAQDQFMTQAHEGEHWGYEPENGPSTWGGLCQTGKRQSPINIQKDCFNGNKTPKITFENYDKNGSVTMTNSGHSVMISGFNNWTLQPFISDGGLGSKYMLNQFHFHWSQNTNGSEHTVDGEHFDAELHMVHIKEGLSFSEASNSSDGLAVLGIFYKIGHNGHSMLALQNGLKEVTKKDASAQIENYVPAVNLPDHLEMFFRYNGSLTTPECNEAVVWTVFAKRLSISSNQIKLLRQIQGPNGKVLNSNVRPRCHYQKDGEFVLLTN